MGAIVLANGVVFERPEERVREYCEVEVYRDRGYRGGYDDHRNPSDVVTAEDVEGANNLYAGIGALDRGRILHSEEIRKHLAGVKDVRLGEITDPAWADAKHRMELLLASFMAFPNVSLGRATKVLHLKRPHLFPVLDPLVVRFLSGNDVEANSFTAGELLEIGSSCIEAVRKDLAGNAKGFEELMTSLADLPTRLTAVRVHGILCWTQEKWVNLADTAGPYGRAGRSLNQKRNGASTSVTSAEGQERPGEVRNIREFRQVKLKAEGVVVTTGSKPPRAHRPLCRELTEERFTEAVVFNEGKKGRYYLRNDLAEAVKDFQAVACMKCKPERPVAGGGQGLA